MMRSFAGQMIVALDLGQELQLGAREASVGCHAPAATLLGGPPQAPLRQHHRRFRSLQQVAVRLVHKVHGSGGGVSNVA